MNPALQSQPAPIVRPAGEIAALELLRNAYVRTQLAANGITFEAACENRLYAVALINIAAELHRRRPL
jgi:hypothetical protein